MPVWCIFQVKARRYDLNEYTNTFLQFSERNKITEKIQTRYLNGVYINFVLYCSHINQINNQTIYKIMSIFKRYKH